MANLVPPHGGKLLPLLVVGEERQEGLKEAKIIPRVRLSSKEASDLIMLAMGAFSPLDGFLKKQDYESVVARMRLKNGLVWPIPITLSVSKEKADTVKEGNRIALLDSDGKEIMTCPPKNQVFMDEKSRIYPIVNSGKLCYSTIDVMY